MDIPLVFYIETKGKEAQRALSKVIEEQDGLEVVSLSDITYFFRKFYEETASS